MGRTRITSRLVLLTTLCALLVACTPRAKTQMRVLMAGSLIIPFDELERAFEARHPDVDVLMEGHGSIQCVRHVTELEELADVVAVADYALIPMLMYEARVPETDRPYADWHLRFATNQLGIAYTPESAYAGEIDAGNWYEILSRPDVLVGLSDPRFDACGYRALMSARLAEEHTGVPDLFHDLFGSRFTRPVRVQTDDDLSTIRVPEVLEPEKGSGLVMRGSSVRLLGLLESGDIDYAFEYRSVSEQHGLEFLALPPEIDLSDATQEATYERVVVSLDLQRFASVTPEFAGHTISYGITIPANAPHPDLAAEFIQLLVGEQGQAIMAQNAQPMISPPLTDDVDALPASLQPLAEPEP